MTVPSMWAVGAYRSSADFRVSSAERAFRYGDGIFGTLRLSRGRLLDGQAHVERLTRAAAAVGLAIPESVSTADRLAGILVGLGAGPGTEGVVRVQVSAGESGRGFGRTGSGEAQVAGWELVELFPAPVSRHPDLTVLDDDLIPIPALPRLKTCSAVAHVMCSREASRRGFDEALRVAGGALLETASSNVFWVAGTVLYTPAVSLPLYPGVTRSVVIAVAEAEGWSVQEGVFPPEVLGSAEAIFLTNAARGLEPVHALEHTDLEWPDRLRTLVSAVERERVRRGVPLPGELSGNDRSDQDP